MTRTIQILRGTTAQNNAYTGSVGELTMDTENNTVRIHDGSTLGGHALANKATTLAGYGITDGANTALSNLTATGENNVAHMAMPSTRYSNITLGATGTSYTAPADGFIIIEGNATSTYSYILLGGSDCENTSSAYTTFSGHYIAATIAVRKNMSFGVWYNDITAGRFRFYYANGAS